MAFPRRLLRKSLVIALCCVAILVEGACSLRAGDDEAESSDRIFSYLANESEVNDGYVVYQRVAFTETKAQDEFVRGYELLARVSRINDKLRIDQRYSEVDELGVIRPRFVESSQLYVGGSKRR